MLKHSRGSQPFAHISASQALLALRGLLVELGVEDAVHHGTKAFRRGHAEDLERAGGRLGEILGLGDWRTRASMTKYINMTRIERDTVCEAHRGIPESDSSEESESDNE